MVADAVLAEIEKIKLEFPQFQFIPTSNSSQYIKNAISNVSSAALWGGILAFVVLLIFLTSFRSTLVIATAIPISIIATFSLIYFGGFTMNIMTLGGLALGIGMLVDYTNLLRRRDKMPIREAIEEAGRRRLRPILMTALTTIMAMIPLAIGLKEGSEAQAPMARAVIGGLISSTLITLVIVPVVYSLFEGRNGKKKKEA